MKATETPLFRNMALTAIVLCALFIIAGIDTPIDDMQMPHLDDPFQWILIGLVGAVIVYSWACCGSDHEENASPEHPDGRLTYPRDE